MNSNTGPILAQTRAELASTLSRLNGQKRAVVMTMGALHEGHLDLVRAARAAADEVIVTIFVNPLQFGPNEDLEAYPRDLPADLRRLQSLGVDVVFAPTTDVIYPREPKIRFCPGALAEKLEGATRPGHFAGMLQVVNILLNLTQPNLAFFGRKDAQQLALIEQMVADLALPVTVVPVDIRREHDGLAMSSRNTYLTAEQRQHALVLFGALQAAQTAAATCSHAEKTAAGRLQAAATAVENYFRGAPGVRLDYAEIVHPRTFDPLIALPSSQLPQEALLVVAAWVGKTRLIDNTNIPLSGAEG